MADEPKNDATALPDIHPGNVVPIICKRLGVPGAVLMLHHDDGTISLIGHGVTYTQANELLSRGIQMNLNQHDQMVLEGHAGMAAQAQAHALAGRAHGGVQ